MHLFSQAWDTLADAERTLKAEQGELTGEQKLQAALVEALLSISQELSQIHHEGINSEYSPGGV